MKIFSEIHSAYFATIASLIREAQSGSLGEARAREIVRQVAYSESVFPILDSIKNEDWIAINREFKTPIANDPEMPLGNLEKRWLKSLLQDRRIALFGVDATGLEDVSPLFGPDDFEYFDQAQDSDPYSDTDYIAHFRDILAAFAQRRAIWLSYRGQRERRMSGEFVPLCLEYSSKDDKFRLRALRSSKEYVINVARIQATRLADPFGANSQAYPKAREKSVTLALTDERGALDRVMLHFSDCRKRSEKVQGQKRAYRIELFYEAGDETEILIRVLSFGPMLRVLAPESFAGAIRERIARQADLFGLVGRAERA